MTADESVSRRLRLRSGIRFEALVDRLVGYALARGELRDVA